MNTMYFTFARMNPPHKGHELLINTMLEAANRNNSDHLIVLSRKCDYDRNPLDFWTKYKYLKIIRPDANIHVATDKYPTFFEWLAYISDLGYKNLCLVAGNDRAKEWKDLAEKYNGQGKYQFDNIDIIVIERQSIDISSTSMRHFAEINDFMSFYNMAPRSLLSTDVTEMFEDVKSALPLA